jgi:hypothetical protein
VSTRETEFSRSAEVAASVRVNRTESKVFVKECWVACELQAPLERAQRKPGGVRDRIE